MPEIDFSGPIGLALRRWRIFAVVGISALVLSAIFSGPSFIQPRYRSQAVLYPVNLNSYSIETRADQLLQLLESNAIRDSIISRFDLVAHYNTDTVAAGGRSALYDQYDERVEIGKTRYESVLIEVTDEDPVLARDMVLAIIHQADLLARDLQRRNSREVLVIMRNSSRQIKTKIDSVEARLNMLRNESGILEYEVQAKELTKGYMRMISDGAPQARKDEVRAMLTALEEKGGEFRTLTELNDLLIAQYSEKLAEEQQVLIDVDKKLTYSNMVVYPEVSDKKVYPVRWVIVLASFLSALFLCHILLSLKDRARNTVPIRS